MDFKLQVFGHTIRDINELIRDDERTLKPISTKNYICDFMGNDKKQYHVSVDIANGNDYTTYRINGKEVSARMFGFFKAMHDINDINARRERLLRDLNEFRKYCKIKPKDNE